jgi:serine/threonine-protein kinase PpkA
MRLAWLFAVLLLCGSAWPASAQEPLKLAEAPEFYQRVLTLPGAMLRGQPQEHADPVGGTLPIFSVLYVYERRTVGSAEWLRVGAKAAGGGDGWLPGAQTQEWRTMLVMQYAPRAQRERAMLFADRPPLEALVHANDGPKRAHDLLTGLEAGQSDPSVVALEPATPVDYSKKPYLMPILDWKADFFADASDTSTFLLELGSANGTKTITSTQNDQLQTNTLPPVLGNEVTVPHDNPPPDLSQFKIALVFLVDTTLSMQPYIDRIREALKHIEQGLEADGTVAHVSFGIVAYRNNMDKDRRIEYVTRIYQALDPNADPKAVLANLDHVQEAKVPTPGWDEDGFAGMYDALTKLDWTPYDARYIITTSDAGAIAGNNRLAHYPGVDLENIVELANRKKVSFFPLYLLTPEGNKHPAERARAIKQYQALGTQTGDPSVNKYTAIPAGSVDGFANTIGAFVDQIRATIKATVGGQLARPAPGIGGGNGTPTTAPGAPVTGGAPAVPTNRAPPPAPSNDPSVTIREALINEIFRAQIEYLGSRAGVEAPGFFKAWTADRDLTHPPYQALRVKVFLTRNQLNGLAQSLRRITDLAKQSALAPDSFFDQLRSLSATMAGDPNRQVAGAFTNIAESGLLPSYLKLLPYKSKMLRMTSEQWRGLQTTGQQTEIDELEYKLTEYQDMYQDLNAWTDFGSGDPGQAVYPVPLETLP